MAITWLVTEPTASNSPAIGTGAGHLMADVAGIVQVEPALEHDLDEAGEVIDTPPRLGGARVDAPVQANPLGAAEQRRGLTDSLGRLDPRQHGTLRPLSASKVGGQQSGQPMAGIFQQTGIIGRGDALAGRGESIRD